MVGRGTGERTLGVTEKLGFEQLLRNGAAVDRRETALVAGAHPMNGAGNDLFAGTALTRDQYRRVVTGHTRCKLQDLPHGRALGNNQFLDRADAHVGPQGLDLTAETLPLLGLAHRHDYFVGIEGLMDVVVRAFSDGCEGGVLGSLLAQHDHDRVPAFGAQPSEEAQSIGSGQLDPAENQLEILSRRTHQRTRGVGLGLDYIAGLSEQQRERLPDIGVVLNDKQPHQFTRDW